MERKINKGIGWVPDLPDQRDFVYMAPRAVLRNLPVKKDLRKQCPHIYDQGQLGSCTANAIGAAFEFGLRKQKLKIFTPSRLFIYYNERVIEHSVSIDNGVMLRDGMKSINKQGVCRNVTGRMTLINLQLSHHLLVIAKHFYTRHYPIIEIAQPETDEELLG